MKLNLRQSEKTALQISGLVVGVASVVFTAILLCVTLLRLAF